MAKYGLEENEDSLMDYMMPPYGTPPHPYVAMYPPGRMYGHPSSLPPGNTEGDGSKQAEVKEKLPIKRSKGSLESLNMIIGKNNDTGKNSGASANGACSKRHVTSRFAKSASDGSSEGSDASSQNDSGSRNNGKGGNLQILLMDHCVLMEVISQRTRSFPSLPTGVPGPPTNLNIGIDYWSGHGNVSTTVPGVVVVDGSQSQTWIHVLCPLPFSIVILQAACLIVLENRMRESLSDRTGSCPIGSLPAECDELAQQADVLNGENASLIAEINELISSCVQNRFTADPSQEGVNLDKNEQELGQNVAETTYGSYNNSA
ncbi:hypothetical protein HID58_029064 [Brassica napus]|uniref:G-box binding protein multifunctional mosaic region domain-containing protein n=1 Tax=Brassica napus TaxID=3708 RepID=A0ABQ8CDK3_BRANA|nr:hypothetical protein HID58_029064 [Brassica napus]